jgi:hypothetical protein
MSIKDGTTTYELERSFKYSHKGKSCDAVYITLYEPSMEHTKYYYTLEQMYTKIMFELMDDFSNFNQEKAIGTEVKQFHEESEKLEENQKDFKGALRIGLMNSQKVSAFDFVEAFRHMCVNKSKKPICLIDEQERMTNAIWENVSPKDALEMAIEWVSFFGTALTEQGPTTLGRQSKSDLQVKEV